MRRHRVLLLAVSIVLAAAASARAQEASVIGTVADETKAVLPGATVTATNLETGGQTVAITGQDGEYRLLKLPPGKYRLQAELTGFSTVILPVGRTARGPERDGAVHDEARAGERVGDCHR